MSTLLSNPQAESGARGAAAPTMFALAERLYPICRSITGEGVRQTLRIVQENIPLDVHEVATGTPVFDWQVPREWNIRDAWVKDSSGRKVIDFQRHNLHLMSYSTPIHRTLPLAELRGHLFSIPERPDWIPYRTSYYAENWGFCLAHRELEALADGVYEVCIDSKLEAGSLTYGELHLPGESGDEILLSTHCCHPSLANDNVAGIALLTFLAQRLLSARRRHSFRFLFIPGTIGAITWLARNADCVSRVKHGLVMACAGDPGPLTYKRSRRGNAPVDRAAEHVLRHSGLASEVIDFTPFGYDTRQFCSPGFNLPVGSLMRTMHERYPEYHTSADDLSLIRPEAMEQTLEAYWQIIQILEWDCRMVNTQPFCEPQLGRRGLYRQMGGMQGGGGRETEAMMWLLNFSDGEHSLLDISERSGLSFPLVHAVSRTLAESGLLQPAPAKQS